MGTQNRGKINHLERLLPEGLIVDSAWMERHGYSRKLRSKYVASGWLEQPTREVYRRPRGSLSWQQVVISVQHLLKQPFHVGGRTALTLQGFEHYLTRQTEEVHLYGPKRPPGWLPKLPLDARFIFHNSDRLFRNDPIYRGIGSVEINPEDGRVKSTESWHFVELSWGQMGWPLTLSTPERAFLELLDEIPDRETFEQADKLMEGLVNLRPRRIEKLLADCKSVKVKRLFFFFADRHQHAWLKRLDKQQVDFGKGKRMLVRGGKLDRTYQITVPEEFHGSR